MPNHALNISNRLKLIIFLTLIFILLLTVKADTIPHLWFDEGWTLSTARNWAEQGKYALRLGNTWVSAEAMTQPFTVTAPIVISFKLFGVGIISGRLPGMLYTIGTFAWMFAIARQLYGNRVAWGTLFFAFILPPAFDFQPLIIGRQALGEMPMLFFLLGGYWFLHQALKQPRNPFTLIGTAIFWGLAIFTKRQPLPFWLLSLWLPLFLALKNKDYQTAKLLTLLTVCTGIFTVLFTFIENSLLAVAPAYGNSIILNLYKLLFLNVNPSIRLQAMLLFLSVGIFPVVGIVYFFKKNRDIFKSRIQFTPNTWVELSLWILVCSWTIWYISGSIGWLRHYLPAYLICWMFFAKAIHDWTENFNWEKTIKKFTASPTKSWKTSMPQLGAILLIAVSASGFVIDATGIASTLSKTDQDAYAVVDYIHSNTTPATLIETYESEFLFLLPDRPIHFPPHQIQVDLNHRTFLNKNATVNYDPLPASPEILIIRYHGMGWGLYDSILKDAKFKPVTKIGRYTIYQRVH